MHDEDANLTLPIFNTSWDS